MTRRNSSAADELDAARKRIAELEAKLAVADVGLHNQIVRTGELEKELAQKDRYAAQLFDMCTEWAAKAGRGDRRVQELEAKQEAQV